MPNIFFIDLQIFKKNMENHVNSELHNKYGALDLTVMIKLVT